MLTFDVEAAINFGGFEYYRQYSTQPSAIFTYSNEKGVRSGGRKYTHAMLLILKDQKKRHENGIQFLFLP